MSECTHQNVSQQQKYRDFLQYPPLPRQFGSVLSSVAMKAKYCRHRIGFCVHVWSFKAAQIFAWLQHIWICNHSDRLDLMEGLPMHTFNYEKVLQAELDHHQYTPGQVEPVQVAFGSSCNHSHDREIADDELSQ